jgi:hypothetical protein
VPVVQLHVDIGLHVQDVVDATRRRSMDQLPVVGGQFNTARRCFAFGQLVDLEIDYGLLILLYKSHYFS